ncbi:MAG: hypothetical protein SF187_11250 [Deltaproteobacteria bacterium]|nr:hypothetical protein [Deltaproteobacteria bacterium]
MFERIGLVFCITLAVGAAAACGGSDSNSDGTGGTGGGGASGAAKVIGSCDNSKGGFCKEFIGASFTAATVEPMCKTLGETTFSANACPKADWVGTCVIGKGTDKEVNNLYYGKDATATATTAQKQCTALKGEWTAAS